MIVLCVKGRLFRAPIVTDRHKNADVGGSPRRRGAAFRPRRVLLRGTLLIASPRRRFFCVI